MSDELYNGRRLRLLRLVDNFTCESLAIEVAPSLGGRRVVEVLMEVIMKRWLPGKILDQWAYLNGVELDFIRSGKPTDNAFVESFNGHFRQEYLNENWFLSLEDAREKIEEWRHHYNKERPHGSPDYLAPLEYRGAQEAIS